MGSYYMSNSAALETSSSTYKVYCVLSKYANYQTRECFVSKKTIASEAKVSLSTVFRALKELCDRGLISVVARFSGKRQTSNLYKLLDNPQISMEEAPKPDKKVRGFSSSTKALTASISATAHKIYDYFQLRAGAQQSFHESKRTIAAQCGVSVSTVSRVLRELRDAGLITIHSQSRKDDNGAAENLYLLHGTPRRQRASKWKLLLVALLSSPMSNLVTPLNAHSEVPKKSTDCTGNPHVNSNTHKGTLLKRPNPFSQAAIKIYELLLHSKNDQNTSDIYTVFSKTYCHIRKNPCLTQNQDQASPMLVLLTTQPMLSTKWE